MFPTSEALVISVWLSQCCNSAIAHDVQEVCQQDIGVDAQELAQLSDCTQFRWIEWGLEMPVRRGEARGLNGNTNHL